MNAIEQFKKGRVIRCQNPSGPLNMGPKKSYLQKNRNR